MYEWTSKESREYELSKWYGATTSPLSQRVGEYFHWLQY